MLKFDLIIQLVFFLPLAVWLLFSVSNTPELQCKMLIGPFPFSLECVNGEAAR